MHQQPEKPLQEHDPKGYDCLAFLWMHQEGRQALEYMEELIGKVKVKGDSLETYGNAAKLELVHKIRRLSKMAYEKRIRK